MKKTLSRVSAMAMAVALITAVVVPIASRASNDSQDGDTEPGRGSSVVSSWVKAVDGNGDANAIGKFNRNESNKKLAKVNGTVKAISASSITVTAAPEASSANTNGTVKKTDYTFAIDSSTVIIRKFKGTATVGEIGVGDMVKVYATKLTDGTAKLIWDKSIWWVSLTGNIASLNTTDMTFNLLVTRKEPQTGLTLTLTVPVKVSSATTYVKADGSAGAFTDLANDQKVNLRGSFNKVGKFVTAGKITIKS